MGIHTPIEWCDSAVNPVMGCDGCELSSRGLADGVDESARPGHCYAESLHVIRAGRPGYADNFFEPKMFAGRMATAARWSDLRGQKREGKPWLDGKPRHIFISDMGDALSASVTFEFLRDEVVANVASAKGARHEWLWLTKRPRRMADFSRWLRERGIEWPRNLWAGTSVTSDATSARVAQLLSIEGAIMRFLSCEPLLGPLDLKRYYLSTLPGRERRHYPFPMLEEEHRTTWLHLLDLVIVGGESGPGARPTNIADIRSVVEQCRASQVPVFCKQLGANPEWETSIGVMSRGLMAPLRLVDRKGGDPVEWPEDLRVREMPRTNGAP